MRVWVGTSGFAYREWKGSFYPEDLPQDEMLRFYSGRFRAVEINNTFYRMPSEKVLARWFGQVPEEFVFVLKASQRITHRKRLRDVGEDLSYFLKNASVLGPKLGPTLFQLPPNMKKDLARLEGFLAILPAHCRAAVEFRHPSWIDEDVHEAMRSRNVALCLAATEEGDPSVVATADWGYLRMRRQQYSEDELQSWAQLVRRQPWEEAFVFFKHEEEGTGPELAHRFEGLLRD